MAKNVIYILCDQLRAQSLGCYGDIDARTPNLDLLATEGVLFKNAVASTPLCTPARGNMMTGRHVHEHSACGHDYHLQHNIEFLSDLFKANKYKTMYFGKWHLDGSHVEVVNEASTLIVPKQNRGNFDIWLGYENNNNQNHFYLHGHDLNGEVNSHLINEYETDYITNLALNHIEQNKEDEMFVWINFQPPHDPYIAPPKYMELFKPNEINLRDNVPRGGQYEKQARLDLAGYNAMIKCIDDNVGKLIEKLKELKIYQDTHIVFTSDHGDMHGSHGQYRKTTFWEESIKVPFIIGGTVPFNNEGMRNRDVDHFIDQYDIAPTLLGLAGINKGSKMVGVDYSYVRYANIDGESKSEVVFGNYIPTYHGDSVNQQFRGIIDETCYKYIIAEHGEVGLYNLKEDKYEQANLLFNPIYQNQLIEMRQKLAKSLTKTNDPFINLEVFGKIKNIQETNDKL